MYNEFYGLSDKPFESLPDPRFLFLTASHRKVITSVMEELRKRRGFIAITGEVGTGKTTLIRHLLSKLEDNEKIKTAFIFHPTMTFKQLLENILLELNLEVTKGSRGAVLRLFNECLKEMDVAGKTLVIIIDEAQDLSGGVMEKLGRLPTLPALQIIFVGQPEFGEKLDLQGLRYLKQKIRIQHRIRAFNEEECQDYIDHRLKLVRSSSSERFTPKAISRICSYSKGIPRVVNILCDNALLRGYSLSRKKVDVDIIVEVIKEMEGPLSRERFLTSVLTTISPPQKDFLLRKAPLMALACLCLAGFVFLIDRYFQPGPAQTPYPRQERMEPISGSNAHQALERSKLLLPEFPESDSPPDESPASVSEEDQTVKMVTVKKGNTVSYLAKTYYGTMHPTLMDFILDLNPEITDANLILPDQKVKIPNVTKALLAKKSTDNSYRIQVGTFWSPDFIRFYVHEPLLEGREVKIFPRKVSRHETWYRVMAGPFGNKEECLNVIDQLKGKGLLPAFGGIPKME